MRRTAAAATAAAAARHATPLLALLLAAAAAVAGCQSLIEATDRDVAALLRERQRAALGVETHVSLDGAGLALPLPTRQAYATSPAVGRDAPGGVSSDDEAAPEAASPAEGGSAPDEAAVADARPTRFRESVLTLTEALAYAQQHRRSYQTAKEDLYLAALSLTLERHLWTPQFAADLRAVYGNFGEVRDFDQAMRFVSELSAAQRLPYGGRFTASAINTLIRDVGRSITAEESGRIALGLEVPLLRGAGHVSREQLIQLERALTYAVRDFERFRRDQLVTVAVQYFDLLRAKQAVYDAVESAQRAAADYARAQAIQDADPGGSVSLPLDTRRAEAFKLRAETTEEQARESFRLATDRFKIEIGMPVDEPIGLDDLEDIEAIERKADDGEYPLLRRPREADDESAAIAAALRDRLDLLNLAEQIDDARRGVALARNALLPDLNWTSSLGFDTDPNHYASWAYEFNRATWRTELILSMNDRFAERTRLRAAVIDVRRAERVLADRVEQVRVDVRRALNNIRLQERVIELQKRNVEVADFRRAYSRQLFEDGELGNRDLVEAEDEWRAARNVLNQAKTDGWAAILGFRLATETLRVDEAGAQHARAE